jgi:hypothetical protein
MNPKSFFESGISVIPVLFASKKPTVRWQKYQSHLPTEQDMQRWFRPGRQTNAAVICGWNGLTVIDFDDMAEYLKWLAWSLTAGEMARRVSGYTYRVKTSRGMHVYLFVDETPRCSHFSWGDIKGKGGYVLIPPSVHPSGAIYTAVDELAPILRVDSLQGIIPDPPAAPVPVCPPTVHVCSSSALWPATVVEEIKEKVSILSLLTDVKATGGSRWFAAKCPFHDDKEPSFWIDAEKGLCGCYSGCTPKPLDVIGLYGRLHSLTNKEAIKQLAEQIR